MIEKLDFKDINWSCFPKEKAFYGKINELIDHANQDDFINLIAKINKARVHIENNYDTIEKIEIINIYEELIEKIIVSIK